VCGLNVYFTNHSGDRSVLNLPNRNTAMAVRAGWLVLLCIVIICVAAWWDDRVGSLLDVSHSPGWRVFATWSSKAGEGWVLLLVGGIIGGGMVIQNRVAAARLVILVTASGLINGAVATILRSLIGRTRPCAHVAQGFYGIWHDSHWIIGRHEFASFPSGHSATVVGFAVAVWLLNRRLGMVAFFYAFLVCWSRVALGAHHFSDIIAATLLAIPGACLVVEHLPIRLEMLFRKLRRVRADWGEDLPGNCAQN
jgi:undecaprenyl-diphosphatase